MLRRLLFGSSSRSPLAFLYLSLIVALLAAPSPSSAQTPSPQATPPPAPPPSSSSPFLSFIDDSLPARSRDLYVARLDGTDKTQVTHDMKIWFATWSPDGKKLAITTERTQIYTLNTDGTGLTLLTVHAGSPAFWSPDGHFLAYIDDSGYAQPIARGNLQIIPAGGGEPWTVPGGDNIPSLPPGAAAVAWSPDGTRIAAGWPGRIFHVADGVGAPVGVEPLPGPAKDWFVVAGGWAPDGKHLAVTDGTEYGILDLTNGNFVSIAKSVKQSVNGIARPGVSWAGGIKKVAYAINSDGSDGQRLFLADLDGNNPKLILSAPHSTAYRGEVSDYGPPNFAGDGKTLLLRVSRTTRQSDGSLLYTHESWLVNTDGSGGAKILDAYNANWQPKPLLNLPDSGFWFQWRVPDQPVATGQAARPYLWGPTPIFSGTEPFASSPNGQQQVLYFDKGRMDLPNPNPPQPTRFLVIPGTLARELVTGQIAVGVTQTQSLAPSTVPVAGDINDPNAPTYATFNILGAGSDAGKSQDRTGQPVTATLARDGTLGQNTDPANAVKNAAFVPETAHNIPDVFLNWFHAQSWDWIYVAGYPISEPYWSNVLVGGQTHSVLIQIYERRTITYDPQAPDPFKVQFGNVGRHYYDWRYASK
jgi:Tol biopolymer transport system component